MFEGVVFVCGAGRNGITIITGFTLFSAVKFSKKDDCPQGEFELQILD
jgi:hypothetical protein